MRFIYIYIYNCESVTKFPLPLLLNDVFESKDIPNQNYKHARCEWRVRPPDMRRIAASIVNRQSWTADKVWYSTLRVGRGANSLP